MSRQGQQKSFPSLTLPPELLFVVLTYFKNDDCSVCNECVTFRNNSSLLKLGARSQGITTGMILEL